MPLELDSFFVTSMPRVGKIKKKKIIQDRWQMTFHKRWYVNSGEALGLIKMAGSHPDCMGEGKMTVCF